MGGMGAGMEGMPGAAPGIPGAEEGGFEEPAEEEGVENEFA